MVERPRPAININKSELRPSKSRASEEAQLSQRVLLPRGLLFCGRLYGSQRRTRGSAARQQARPGWDEHLVRIRLGVKHQAQEPGLHLIPILIAPPDGFVRVG